MSRIAPPSNERFLPCYALQLFRRRRAAKEIPSIAKIAPAPGSGTAEMSVPLPGVNVEVIAQFVPS